MCLQMITTSLSTSFPTLIRSIWSIFIEIYVITTDFQNFHVCGKNQTCVGIANDFLNYHVCGFYHTCVFFTKYLRHVKVFAKNHTCVVKTQYVCVFPITWWSILNGSTLKRNKNIWRTTMRFVSIEGAGRCKI